MASMVFLRLLTPSTVAICAICEVSSALPSGSGGSWFCNCAVSSFRNWSCRPCAVMELFGGTCLGQGHAGSAGVFIDGGHGFTLPGIRLTDGCQVFCINDLAVFNTSTLA